MSKYKLKERLNIVSHNACSGGLVFVVGYPKEPVTGLTPNDFIGVEIDTEIAKGVYKVKL